MSARNTEQLEAHLLLLERYGLLDVRDTAPKERIH
ncbi:hypothetical protein AGROH133_15314 (plasmid) [Agrobacterium tumefaciens]|nr:hypothetical protein AGROH133_15314 [Agrobacterium tumefaciens]